MFIPFDFFWDLLKQFLAQLLIIVIFIFIVFIVVLLYNTYMSRSTCHMSRYCIKKLLTCLITSLLTYFLSIYDSHLMVYVAIVVDPELLNINMLNLHSCRQARTQDFLTGGGYKVLKSPSQPNAARGLGERCKLPQRGLGRSPSRQRFWRLLDYNEDVWCNIISNLHRKLLFEI